MALDPEEMKRRRHARQEQRRQQQLQRKKTFIKLGIAAVVLVLCGVLILLLTRRDEPAKPPVQTDSATAQSVPEQTVPSTESPTTVIHLAAAGDLNVTETVVGSATGEYDYTETIMDVAHVLAQADITTVNLEGSFFGTPYGTDRSAPPTLAQALASAGVDLVQIANSYSIYKGMDGLAATANTIRSAGMEPVGAYASSQEAKEGKGYTIRNVRGIEIAFVSFTKGMDGMALPPGNEKCVNLLYTDYATDYQRVDTEGITAILDAVEKEKPDITVALLHWGSEHNNTISESQQQICELFRQEGVDVIIGTHSHYVQKMVHDEETGTFVAYSLGDFLGDATRSGSEYSVILDLEITKDNKSGKTKVTDFSYTPIFNAVEKDKPLRLLRIQEAMAAYEGGYIDRVSETTYEAMKYALSRIEARIHGE